MKKIKDILKLRYIVELSFPKIAIATNIPRSTASDYCKRFEISKYTIDDFLEMDEDVIYKYSFLKKD